MDVKIKLMLLVFVFSSVFGFAQDTILEKYIQQGLKSNLVLKQHNLSLGNALYTLKKAKNHYIPSLDFQTTYTTAEGGRSADVPVGDMMNPVYSTLNQFMGQNAFPMIENQKINFLPKNYYDARVRLSVPIVNMDIIHNNHIKEKQLEIKGHEIEIYKRELVKEIKVTYYQYLTVLKAIDIHQNAIEMAKESMRSNERLLEAGKGLHAYVLRSETEVEQAKARLKSTQYQAVTLQRYFNALLNRDSEAKIEVEAKESLIPSFNDAIIGSKNREELQSLEQNIALRNELVKMKKQVFIPKLSGFADLGSQAEELRFNDESMYYMVGLKLDIPLFQGWRNRFEIKMAKNELEIAKLKKKQVEQQMDVAVTRAHNDVLEAKSNYSASIKQLDMAETYYRLIKKGYSSGVNTYMETVDARTQLSTAKLASNVAYYKLLSALARLERETASYPLPKQENE